MKHSLRRYRAKRDFSRTGEPRGSRRRSKKRPRYVIQKHKASRLHYDFRLEIGGVLKSWAVPKGPSLNPRDKRLAVETEDHPVEYADFEGVIPEGEYGAGTVMVWDRGTFQDLRRRKETKRQLLETAWRSGHLKVRLRGKKLKGGFALSRVRDKQ